ncbi:unnamed protein product [Rotaria sp. Silwood2]|nr:unnamed protein product [Rotaria sp. Silwood2]CAF3901476.1 unnamed protein product [Rotaria sp. Silwood2]
MNANNQIATFFSHFSLDEFPNLRSLHLIEIDEHDASGLKEMLSSLSNLHYFYLTVSSDGTDKILTALPTTSITLLSIPKLELKPVFNDQFMLVINLTINQCSAKELSQLFLYLPKLKSLSIEHLSESSSFDINEYVAVHLKQLILNQITAGFDFLAMLFRQTQNLRSLKISAHDHKEFIDACRWQHLITSSLHFLIYFNFKFHSTLVYENSVIADKFQDFQSDFWHQRHH